MSLSSRARTLVPGGARAASAKSSARTLSPRTTSASSRSSSSDCRIPPAKRNSGPSPPPFEHQEEPRVQTAECRFAQRSSHDRYARDLPETAPAGHEQQRGADLGDTRTNTDAGRLVRDPRDPLFARTGAGQATVGDARKPRSPALDCVFTTIGAMAVEPKRKSGSSATT